MVRPRLSWRTVAWIFLLGLAVVWAYNYTRLIQGFQNTDEEKAVQAELTTAMTSVSEMLCPMQQEVLQKLVEDEITNLESENQEGFSDITDTSEAAQAGKEKASKSAQIKTISPELRKQLTLKAAANFLKTAQGPVFPCPPPSNPQEIPVAIKDYMLATCRGCLPTVYKIKEDVAKARECHKIEGFESQSRVQSDGSFTVINPVYITHTTKEAYEDIETTEEEIVRKNRIVSLQAKLRGIKEAMMDPLFIRTTVDYKEVKSLKEQAENGTMTSNCST